MLSSWKEIAHFFGKGVRTVQRWEKTLDLPIRRPPGAPSNVVLARTSDLEEWMHRSSAARDAVANQDTQVDSLQSAISELEIEVRAWSEVGPQPIDTSTEKSTAEPVERINQIITMVRDLKRDGTHGSLKRVA